MSMQWTGPSVPLTTTVSELDSLGEYLCRPRLLSVMTYWIITKRTKGQPLVKQNTEAKTTKWSCKKHRLGDVSVGGKSEILAALVFVDILRCSSSLSRNQWTFVLLYWNVTFPASSCEALFLPENQYMAKIPTKVHLQCSHLLSTKELSPQLFKVILTGSKSGREGNRWFCAHSKENTQGVHFPSSSQGRFSSRNSARSENSPQEVVLEDPLRNLGSYRLL